MREDEHVLLTVSDETAQCLRESRQVDVARSMHFLHAAKHLDGVINWRTASIGKTTPESRKALDGGLQQILFQVKLWWQEDVVVEVLSTTRRRSHPQRE